MDKVKEEIFVHPGYAEFQRARKEGVMIQPVFGKRQHIFSSEKGKISVAEFRDVIRGGWFWEMYCLEGDLFEGVLKFLVKEDALEKARDYLK